MIKNVTLFINMDAVVDNCFWSINDDKGHSCLAPEQHVDTPFEETWKDRPLNRLKNINYIFFTKMNVFRKQQGKTNSLNQTLGWKKVINQQQF